MWIEELNKYLNTYGLHKSNYITPNIITHKISIGLCWVVVFRFAMCSNQSLCRKVYNMRKTPIAKIFSIEKMKK